MRRKATSLSLDPELLAEARALSINVSQAAEDGLTRAIRTARELHWREANAEAIESANDYVARHGLPLDAFRQF